MIIYDRKEGGIVIIEDDGIIKSVDGALVDDTACEGDVLVMREGIYVPDKEVTEKRREAMRSRFGRLRRKRNDD